MLWKILGEPSAACRSCRPRLALALRFAEPRIGITGVFLACGALSVPVLVAMAFLREPSRTALGESPSVTSDRIGAER